MISGLDETVLRQVDNLFLLYLPFDDDVRHISKSAMVDQETMGSFVKRLRRHHALILGDVTRQYPVIVKVKELKGIHTAGETQYFFKPKRRRARKAIRQYLNSLSLKCSSITCQKWNTTAYRQTSRHYP